MRHSASLVVAAMLAGVSLIAAPQGQRGAPPPAASPQQLPKGTGVIAGQVIDAGTNLPIAGATVMMNPRLAARAGGPGPAAAGPIRLITGADGRFVMRDLLKGSYVINAFADGYIGGATGQARPGATSEPVDVGDGARVTDVRIRLWKNAVITGTVIDEAGEPAVVTPVRVFRRIAVAGRVRYTPTVYATTDDRGVYRASGLSPGDYVVAVPQTQATMPSAIMDSMLQGIAGGGSPITGALMDVMSSGGGGAIRGTGMRVGDLMLSSESGSPAPASDGRLFAYQTVLYPAAVSLAQANLVTLRSGEERSGIDLQLKLAPTFRVSGAVSFPGGGAGLLTVRLAPATDDGAGDLGFDVATAATRQDGTFTFLGVPPGQFFVRVVKPPRPPIPPELANNPMVQMAFGGAGGSAQGLYGEVPITVGGSDINDIAIVLSEGAKLTGRLVFDGSLAPPQAQQLRSITISLQAADGRSVGALSGFQQSTVDQDATFKTPNYPAGKYLINAGNGGQGWIVRSIIADGRDATNEPIELRDADLTNVVITYTDKIGQVSGTVHVAQSASIASGSTVFMFPADYRARIASADARRFRNAAVSRTGAYTFGGLAAGEYLVAALDVDDVPENRDTPFFDALSRVATRVTIGEGEKKVQDLQFVKVAR